MSRLIGGVKDNRKAVILFYEIAGGRNRVTDHAYTCSVVNVDRSALGELDSHSSKVFCLLLLPRYASIVSELLCEIKLLSQRRQSQALRRRTPPRVQIPIYLIFTRFC